MKTVNLLKELELVDEYWSPRVVGRVNDQFIKVTKLKGSLTWHKHDDEDELFYILKGRLVIEYEKDRVVLNEGDFHVVPRGAMHNPVAEDECWTLSWKPFPRSTPGTCSSTRQDRYKSNSGKPRAAGSTGYQAGRRRPFSSAVYGSQARPVTAT